MNEENCSTEILQTPLPLLTDVVVNRLVRTLICQSSHFGKGKKLIMYLSFYICSCWIRTLARPQARRGKNRPLWFFNSKSLYCSESTPGRSPQAPYHRIVTNVQTTFAKKIFVEKDYGQNTNWLICMWTYLIPKASVIWIQKHQFWRFNISTGHMGSRKRNEDRSVLWLYSLHEQEERWR